MSLLSDDERHIADIANKRFGTHDSENFNSLSQC